MFTVEKPVVYEEQIRKSRFIGHLSKTTTTEEAKSYIGLISSQYRDASHNCWAYIIGLTGATYHFSDAGEPSGTAGKPILTALQRAGISNATMVVTRYFGGVKLGIRGLIEAYRQIAESTLSKGVLQEMTLKDFWEITTGYASADKLKYTLLEMNTEIISTEYKEEVTIQVSGRADSELKEYLSQSQNAGLLKFKLLRTGLD